MATVNPSVVTAFNSGVQNFYTIEYPGVNIFPNQIANISKADPAVVTTSSAITISSTGTVGTIAGSGPYTAIITGMSSTAGLLEGAVISATAGTGNLGVGTTRVTSILGNKSVAISSSATQNAGTITAIKIPAPVTIPVDFADNAPILITGVEGMTQLATAGADGTNLFYANVLTSTTFELYSNQDLDAGVDSTGFSNAVANTGSYNTFTGIQYVSNGANIALVFPTVETDVGTDIAIDATSGEITLAADITYEIIVETQAALNPESQSGTIVLYNQFVGENIGAPTPIGQTLVATVTTPAESILQVFAVAPNNKDWIPPAGIQYATISIKAVSGFEQ